MIERDTRLKALLLPLIGLLALVVAGVVDFALYRLQLRVNRFFEPDPIVVFGALTAGALVVAGFLVTVAWLSLRTPTPTRSAGLLLLLLGLPAAFAPLLFGLNLLRWLPYRPIHVSGEQLRLAGAFLTVLGLVAVLQPNKK